MTPALLTPRQVRHQGGVSPVIAALCYSADVTLVVVLEQCEWGLLMSPWKPNLTHVIAACCYHYHRSRQLAVGAEHTW